MAALAMSIHAATQRKRSGGTTVALVSSIICTVVVVLDGGGVGFPFTICTLGVALEVRVWFHLQSFANASPFGPLPFPPPAHLPPPPL